jgi:hypothetical protein
MPFPTSVNITQAPAVAGDFASSNPRNAVTSNVSGWTAGSGGVAVGTFAWGDLTSTDSVLSQGGTGVPTGFVARELGDALITTYLSETGNVIPQGFPVPLFNAGDFWVNNSGSGAAAIGMKAYANLTTGVVLFDATGQVGSHSGYVETKFYCVGWGGGTGAQNELVIISDKSLD